MDAGIFTVGVTSSYPEEYLLEAGAAMTIQDFNSEELWQLLNSKVKAIN